MNFIVRNASPHDLVGVVFVKIWVIPVEITHLDQKFALILSTSISRKFASHQVVDDVSVPRELGDSE